MIAQATGIASAASGAAGYGAWTGFNPPGDRLTLVDTSWARCYSGNTPQLFWYRKLHTDEILDYYIDWGDAIEPLRYGDADPQETVVSCTAVVISGTVAIVSSDLKGAMLQLILSGGVLYEITIIETTLVTSKGRTYTARVKLRVGNF
jgi:hypothetical protein